MKYTIIAKSPSEFLRFYQTGVGSTWGGKDEPPDFNRCLLFRPCQGTPCISETHDLKGFEPGVAPDDHSF